jgi:hypothetical protein
MGASLWESLMEAPMDNVIAAQTQPRSSKRKEVALVCIGGEREAIAFAQKEESRKTWLGLSIE